VPGPAPASAPGNLPAPTTKFVGREREVADLAARLHSPACRLLTLIGPGGIGKTRLALQAAQQAAAEAEPPFPDGVYFVSLAALSAPEQVVPAVAEALRFTFYGGEDVRGQLLGHLRDRRALLVLDNFEHLLDAAGLVTALLQSAPGVKFLVTSQERLNLQGEWLFEVEALPYPLAGEGGPEPLAYGAVQLFLESARRVDAGFTLTPEVLPAVLHICRLVGGMPLGVELAAAWVRTISPPEIAREIEANVNFLTTNQRDVPERHRSLRAVFDYAWQRLTEHERVQYRRLSIFWGFRREVAEAVAGATLSDLSALVDKSLLRRSGDGRYGMHGLLRKYAQVKLKESGEWAAVRDHHLECCLDLARRAEPGLRTGEQLDWLARLETEHDNLRAAMKWSEESGRYEAGQAIAGGLARFWYLRGYWQEGRAWLARMLALGPAGEALSAAPTAVKAGRAAALMGAGWLADESGQEGPLYEEALALCQATGQVWGEAFALRGVAVRASNEGEVELAQTLLARSLALFEQLGDAWGQGLVQYNLGWLDFSDNNYGASGERWSAALAHFRQAGDRWGQGVTLGGLSYLARLRDEYAAASSLSEQGLAVFRELGDKAGMAVSLVRLAQIAFRRGNYPQAIDLINESLTLEHDLDDKRGLLNSQSLLGLVYAYQGQYPEAMALLQASHALGDSLWGADGTPYIVNYRAMAAYMSGQVDEARGLWEQALQVLREQEDKLGTAASLHGLGLVAQRNGDFAQAEEWLSYSLALYRETKDRRYVAMLLTALGRLDLAQGFPEPAAERLAESLALRRDLGDRQGVAETLETMARLWMAAKPPQPTRAAQLLGAAQALRQIIGAPVPAIDRDDYQALRAAVSAALTTAEYAAARVDGERLAGTALDKLLDDTLAQGAGLSA
jgi:predicted ATPase